MFYWVCTARFWYLLNGATGVFSMESCQKLPPCSMEPMPAGCKMDLALAKAEHISRGGCSCDELAATLIPHPPFLPEGRSQRKWGIKKSFMLEKTFQIIMSDLLLDSTPPFQLDHGTKCPIECFLKHLEGHWLYHLPGQAIPISNHSFCEEFLHNVQPKSPLEQHKTKFSHPIAKLT